MQRLRASLSALLVSGLCGCAVQDTRRYFDVAISTEPAGASCLLTGGAEAVTEAPATPAVVRVPQAPRDLRVFCTAPGHAPAEAVLPVEFDRRQLAAAGVMVAVTPLMYAGGMAGAMIAAAQRYPERLVVQLRAVRFATEAERDAFFAARAAESRRHFERPIGALKATCRADEFGCQHTIASMERARDEELARIEALRAATAPSP